MFSRRGGTAIIDRTETVGNDTEGLERGVLFMCPLLDPVILARAVSYLCGVVGSKVSESEVLEAWGVSSTTRDDMFENPTRFAQNLAETARKRLFPSQFTREWDGLMQRSGKIPCLRQGFSPHVVERLARRFLVAGALPHSKLAFEAALELSCESTMLYEFRKLVYRPPSNAVEYTFERAVEAINSFDFKKTGSTVYVVVEDVRGADIAAQLANQYRHLFIDPMGLVSMRAAEPDKTVEQLKSKHVETILYTFDELVERLLPDDREEVAEPEEKWPPWPEEPL